MQVTKAEVLMLVKKTQIGNVSKILQTVNYPSWLFAKLPETETLELFLKQSTAMARDNQKSFVNDSRITTGTIDGSSKLHCPPLIISTRYKNIILLPFCSA